MLNQAQLVTAFTGLLIWIAPAALWGQAVGPEYGYALLTPEAVEQQAQQLFQQPTRYGEAGNLMEQAAHMRAVDDPATIRLLLTAARLQAYAGDLARASTNMRDAGWRALGNGQLVTAANAYADAALIAIQQQDIPAARECVRIVKLLAYWPKVTASQRKQILARLG